MRVLFLLSAIGTAASWMPAHAGIITLHDSQPTIDYPHNGNCLYLPNELPYAQFDFSNQPRLTNLKSIEISLTMYDGDTGIGEFDRNQLFLGLDGQNVGIKLNGYNSDQENTLTFRLSDTDPNWLSSQQVNTLLSNLNADNQLLASIIDISPDDNCVHLSSFFDTTIKLTGEMGSPSPVPEPMSLAVWGMGLGAVTYYRRRRVTA